MDEGLTIVLDIGKTQTKASLWSAAGELIARETRPNQRLDAGAYAALDYSGIEAWAAKVLRDFCRQGKVANIVPVAHGAGLAVLRDGSLTYPPIDYEEPVPAEVRDDYNQSRDMFINTGSPRLPDGLNSGVQLAWLEALYPDLFTRDACILTWAQYWAWVFCGVAATEITSLGCHTDLWAPYQQKPSSLSIRRGWAARMAPLRKANDVLAPLRQEWVERTGLPSTTKVFCGLHDSNAALLAARGFSEIADGESTVLSTGTWFVAMRSLGAVGAVDPAALAEDRDCLLNVDVAGRPVPSSRFMGGREIEILLGGPDGGPAVQSIPVEVAARILENEARILPTFTPGVGPFPLGRGRWVDMPSDEAGRLATISLYIALVADAALGLIGARERILIEGRFAEARTCMRALKSLRPSDQIFVSSVHHDVSYGALRLVNPDLHPSSALEAIQPLNVCIAPYASRWRRDVESTAATA